MKKYKYIVFCPYFGKLPNNIELWIKSCSYNKEFKFIVFSNDKVDTNLPENVQFEIMDFEQFKNIIQSKFEFQISIPTPYKLCDFKTAYGYIFEDYLEESEYFGVCDMDVIFGNLSKYMPKTEYDKISIKAHLMLFKNTKKIREAFMISNTSAINYKDILSSPVHFGCDEIGDYGINNIFEKNGMTIYHYESHVADISPKMNNMKISPIKDDKRKIKRVFSFENGKILSHDLYRGNISMKEYAYIHFQKRKMENHVNTNFINKFIITFSSFENYNTISKEYILDHQPLYKVKYKNIKIRYDALKRRINRKREIGKIKKSKV